MSTTKAPRQAQPASPAALDKRDVVSNMTRFMDARSLNSMRMTQSDWRSLLPACVNQEVWTQSKGETCAQGWDFDPGTIMRAALCAWQWISYPNPTQHLRLYVRSDRVHEFQNNETVRCMVDHAFPMEVTLLHSPTQAALQDPDVREAASAMQMRSGHLEQEEFDEVSRKAMQAAAMVARTYIDNAQPLFDNLTPPRTLLVADVGSAQPGFASEEHRLLAQTIRFEEDRTEISAEEFEFMFSLVELPPRMSELTTIGANAFLGCTGLRELGQMNALTYIGMFAFDGCSGLQTLGQMDNLRTIDHGAFNDCTGLQTLGDMKALNRIAYAAFQGCSGLTGLGNMNNLNTILDQAFHGCTRLQRLDQMKKLRTIHSMAFASCTQLQRFEIPRTMAHVGEGAFVECPLELLTIEPGEFEFECLDTTLLQKLQSHPRVSIDVPMVKVRDLN